MMGADLVIDVQDCFTYLGGDDSDTLLSLSAA